MGRKEWWRLRDSQGRPPGVLGMWSSRAVTFVENHDTGSTQVPNTEAGQFLTETSSVGL